jgi:hypothetical protein
MIVNKNTFNGAITYLSEGCGCCSHEFESDNNGIFTDETRMKIYHELKENISMAKEVCGELDFDFSELLETE